MTASELGQWAQETFGRAQLGDSRRVARLVKMGEQAARCPAGKVTEVFESSAAREGAFRLLESTTVTPEAVGDAVFEATAQRCKQLVYVAIDGSSLTLSDKAMHREIGRIGCGFPTRGLCVMSALAVDAQGSAVGLLAQRWWARSQEPKRAKNMKCFGQKYLDRETRYWLDAIDDSEHRLHENAEGCRAWYQLDRGGDCWPVLQKAIQERLLLTVRANHNRRLIAPDGRKLYLRQTLRAQKLLGHYRLEVPARPNRSARCARIALRSCRVTIHARVASKRRQQFALNAVVAEEVGYRGGDRIQWFLLTTAPVGSFEAARAVVHGYTLRWRVEEFHRAWKRGLCRVEESQLQSRRALIKWATVLGAVAARALRLARLVRTTPEIPAAAEFSEYEIDAAFILTKKKRDHRRALQFAEVIELIAELGGFAHKYSGAKPGATVLGRGLERVQILALGLKNMAEMR